MNEGGEPGHVTVLRALNEIPFNVGSRLLIDFLNGNKSNKSIKSNRMYKLDTFGALPLMCDDDIKDILDKLTINKMISRVPINGNPFAKAFELTPAGIKELMEPSLHVKGNKATKCEDIRAEITESDKKIFSQFSFFLDKYNNEQKKCIISPESRILCIAGAGTGKTTTLTKRIEFLVRFRSVPAEKVLAITFTRKAKRQLEERLSAAPGCNRVIVETFNSFCEKILKRDGGLIYTKKVKMIDYSGKVRMVNRAIKMAGMKPRDLINSYFTRSQRRNKTEQELFMQVVNDIFYVVDFFKTERKRISHSKLMIENIDYREKETINRFLDVAILVDALMKKGGLRDFTDQLEDTIRLFEKHPDIIPGFEHVLVDEYQDVNSSQIRLIELLNPPNLFVVGDPRQAIFGWRGSKIEYIINFKDQYKEATTIPLIKNYRSGENIVSVANETIKLMCMPDIESAKKLPNAIELNHYDNESDELHAVAERISEMDVPPNEIFVLARTNRQLLDLSRLLRGKGIKHVVKSDELLRSKKESPDDVILSTIHAIKGLEARFVFVIGCTRQNFPCRASEHPVADIFKVNHYDREEEERRLFYVAITRAKERLILSYYGKSLTSYINGKMKEIIEKSSKDAPRIKILKGKKTASKSSSYKSFEPTGNLFDDLRTWRLMQADVEGLPAYRILQNATIAQIVKEKPKSLDALEKVKGIGPAKIAKYGDDILEIISSVK